MRSGMQSSNCQHIKSLCAFSGDSPVLPPKISGSMVSLPNVHPVHLFGLSSWFQLPFTVTSHAFPSSADMPALLFHASMGVSLPGTTNSCPPSFCI